MKRKPAQRPTVPYERADGTIEHLPALPDGEGVDWKQVAEDDTRREALAREAAENAEREPVKKRIRITTKNYTKGKLK